MLRKLIQVSLILFSISCSEVKLAEKEFNFQNAESKDSVDFFDIPNNSFRVNVYDYNEIDNITFEITGGSTKNNITEKEISLVYEGKSKISFLDLISLPKWPSEPSYDSYRFNIKSTRFLSKETADWFKEKTSGGTTSCMMNFNLDSNPKKLNFAIIGNLKIKYRGEEIVLKGLIIGQGRSLGINNNWWFGGKGFESIEIPGSHKGMIDFILGKQVETKNHGKLFLYFHVDDHFKSNTIEFGIRSYQ